MKSESTAHTARRVLIGRIEQLALGPVEAELTFEGRLAAENGWSREHADLVCREYRRFLIIIAAEGIEATPSDAVDQAWHLHLSYTRSYWEGLCRDILGRELHHDPTTGGVERLEHYRDRYAATLDAYRRVFGEEPPASVWPSPDQRFTGRFARVDTTRKLVVGTEGVVLVGSGSLLAAVMSVFGHTGFPVLFGMMAALVSLVTAASLAHGTWGVSHSGGSGDGGGGCGGDAGGCGSGCGGGGCGCG